MTTPTIGHNAAPDMIETAATIAADLSDWMKNHPVVETMGEAADAKVYIDRAKLGLKDLDDERDGKVRPLNEQVKSINDSYRQPRGLVERVLEELQSRVGDFLKAEEAKRVAAAIEAQRIAREAERAAREAERVEQERLADAKAGELDVDVAQLTEEADGAFREFAKAQRQAVIAERATKVKLTGGFSRAIGLRTTETLIVVDLLKAIGAIGETNDILEAVIKGAKAYRKLKGTLPPGVAADAERNV